MNDHLESEQRLSALRPDGHREKVCVADVRGKITSVKNWIYLLLIVIYAVMPWITIEGNPAIFIDIPERKFFLFGYVFSPRDFYLFFFLLSGTAFTLFYLTAVAGRIWCGFLCPQTVFIDGVFRKIERWIEGPKSQQILLANQSWNVAKTRKFIIKHGLFVVSALVISHIFLSYFLSLDKLFFYMQQNPLAHWDAFLWMAVTTTLLYINFAWFREQLCLIVCPYGKLQSALIDDDSFIVGYDTLRGEPRGKLKDEQRGHCIDCHRCIDVCPTGIDIRNGLQLDCIGCANCIDACDEIMTKIGQPSGLIRFDSLNGLLGKKRNIFRPRLYLYTFLLVLGVCVFSYYLYRHQDVDARVFRAPGLAYTHTNSVYRNQFLVDIMNASAHEDTFEISVNLPSFARLIMPQSVVHLKGLEKRQVPIFVTVDEKLLTSEFEFEIRVLSRHSQKSNSFQMTFIGPVGSGTNGK